VKIFIYPIMKPAQSVYNVNMLREGRIWDKQLSTGGTGGIQFPAGAGNFLFATILRGASIAQWYSAGLRAV
jgi:hypothetical protein